MAAAPPCKLKANASHDFGTELWTDEKNSEVSAASEVTSEALEKHFVSFFFEINGGVNMTTLFIARKRWSGIF